MTGAAQATLVDRGAGMVYDTVLNITVLKDWNLAKTSNFAGADSTGAMNWDTATSWASDLVFAGYSDWRLPTSLNQDGNTCLAYNCSGSELGQIWHVGLGNVAGSFSNSGPFANMQPGLYWTSTSYPNPWNPVAFGVDNGYQSSMGGSGYLEFAVAVRTGDVSAVPEPQTFGLMSLGLLVVAGATLRRRMTKQSAPQNSVMVQSERRNVTCAPPG